MRPSQKPNSELAPEELPGDTKVRFCLRVALRLRPGARKTQPASTMVEKGSVGQKWHFFVIMHYYLRDKNFITFQVDTQ
jgi:hypothetical protein